METSLESLMYEQRIMSQFLTCVTSRESLYSCRGPRNPREATRLDLTSRGTVPIRPALNLYTLFVFLFFLPTRFHRVLAIGAKPDVEGNGIREQVDTGNKISHLKKKRKGKIFQGNGKRGHFRAQGRPRK